MYAWKPPSPIGICWTRMQSESGQGLAEIVGRKEIERRSGNGIFLWGVGNAPSRAIPQLARLGVPIEVIFSKMKSKPKAQDIAPASIVAWRRWVDAFGAVHDLPKNVLVTSRAGRRDCHYALMCHSEHPLALADRGPFDSGTYRNFGGGRPVGASQTTALLEKCSETPDSDAGYRVAMQAQLVGGLWVKLIDPVEVSSSLRAALDKAPSNSSDWLKLVAATRGGRDAASQPNQFQQEKLFAL